MTVGFSERYSLVANELMKKEVTKMSDSSVVGYEWYSETDMKLPLFATHSH